MYQDQFPSLEPSYRYRRVLTTSAPVLLQIEDAFALPGYLGDVLVTFGMITIIIGAGAYVVNGPGSWGRGYGRWLFFSGVVMTIVGFDFSGFVAIVRSLMTGG
jgi:hypothetical protein